MGGGGGGVLDLGSIFFWIDIFKYDFVFSIINKF